VGSQAFKVRPMLEYGLARVRRQQPCQRPAAKKRGCACHAATEAGHRAQGARMGLIDRPRLLFKFKNELKTGSTLLCSKR
jgi:hypothetical protein